MAALAPASSRGGDLALASQGRDPGEAVRARRTDANHKAIAAAYRELGCSVADTSGVGGGFPDLVIGCNHLTDLVEIKTEKGPTKASQVLFYADWKGAKVKVIRDIGAVAEHVAALRRTQGPAEITWTRADFGLESA